MRIISRNLFVAACLVSGIALARGYEYTVNYSCSTGPDIGCLHAMWSSAIHSDGENLFVKSPGSLEVDIFSRDGVYKIVGIDQVGRFSFSEAVSGTLVHPEKLPVILVRDIGGQLEFDRIHFIKEVFSAFGEDIVYLEGESISFLSHRDRVSKKAESYGLGDGGVSDLTCSDARCYLVKGAAIYSSENLKEWTHVVDLGEDLKKRRLGNTLYGGGYLIRYFWGEEEVRVYDGSSWKEFMLGFRVVDATWNGKSFVLLGHAGHLAFFSGGMLEDAYIVDSGGEMKGAGGIHYDGNNYFIVGISNDQFITAEERKGYGRPYFVLKSGDGRKWVNISNNLNGRLIGAIKDGSLIRVSCREGTSCQEKE